MQQTDSTGAPGFLPARIGNAQPTMSSVELAELCETRHNQITDTIERLFDKGVLRESRKTTRKVQPTGGGRPMDAYDLTKRDSLVVVSGYNDEVRAKIIDRWMELESGAALPASASASVDEVGKVFAGLKRIARTAGLLGNQAVLAAAKGTRKIVGTDPLALVDVTHLTAPQNEALITPTEIGNRLGGMSGKKVNDVLTGEGFQTQHRDRKQRVYYEPTPKGIEAGGVMSDTGKKHGDGTPVRQLRWASRIVELLRSLIGGRA